MPNDAPLSDRVEKADRGSRELDAEYELGLLMDDILAFGMSVTRDGRRVDPMDFYTDAAALKARGL